MGRFIYRPRPDYGQWEEVEARGRAARERVAMRKKQVVEWLQPMAVWDTNCSGTHRDTKSVEWMKAAVIKFHQDFMQGCPLVYGIELHPGGHGAHWHGTAQIMHRAPTPELRKALRTELWEAWSDLYGRARFDPPRSISNTIGYALKDSLGETIKDGDWGILGFVPGNDSTKLVRACQRRAFRFRQGLESPKATVIPSCERVRPRSPADVLLTCERDKTNNRATLERSSRSVVVEWQETLFPVNAKPGHRAIKIAAGRA